MRSSPKKNNHEISLRFAYAICINERRRKKTAIEVSHTNIALKGEEKSLAREQTQDTQERKTKRHREGKKERERKREGERARKRDEKRLIYTF